MERGVLPVEQRTIFTGQLKDIPTLKLNHIREIITIWMTPNPLGRKQESIFQLKQPVLLLMECIVKTVRILLLPFRHIELATFGIALLNLGYAY